MRNHFTEIFSGWQSRRRKLCHDHIKNSMLNVILAVIDSVDGREMIDYADWHDRLSRWEACLNEARLMALSAPTELSPARFLEADIWLRLSSDERRRCGLILEDDWWRYYDIGVKVDAATTSIGLAVDAVKCCFFTIESRGIDSSQFAVDLANLAKHARDADEALRAFEFRELW